MSTPGAPGSRPVPGTPGGPAVGNPFDSDPAARRYAAARPYYHRSAVSLAARQLGIGRARLAVDLGCGTGLSTRAARELADHVVAIDASAAMLRAAERQPGAGYLVAGAERIPVRDGAADLATAGAAFHWFNQPRALAELARVLRGGAGLAVYSDFFHGRLSGRPAFTTWLRESYLPRYPAPARHAYFDAAAAAAAGFGDAGYAEDEIPLPLTAAQLADYLLSQSNAAAAIASGAVTAPALRAQVAGEIAPFFAGGRAEEAVFGIRVWTAVRRP